MLSCIRDEASEMPRNDRMPKPRRGTFLKGGAEGGAGNAASESLRPAKEHGILRDVERAELRRLAEEGRASGLSDEEGEALLDRLDAKYRSLIARKSGA
jgi:hypothetical protein